jgi:nucleoside-triphosphatase THEP1
LPTSYPSPDALLASLISGQRTPKLALLTGSSGSGKTAFCKRMVDRARAEGMPTAGLLSPAVFKAGRKVAIDLQDLRSGERRRLATRRDEASEIKSEGPATGDWQFHLETLDWGNRMLERLLGDLDDLRLLVLDELGPLELQCGEGLQSGLTLIDAWVREGRPGGLACVVVRPALIPQAQERWPQGRVFEVKG